MSGGPKVFTIPAGADFAAALAEGLKARGGADPLALSDAIIYLPTRRAARGFGDAFAKMLGGAALLPQLRALGDSDEDDLLFDAASEALEPAPAIAPIRRQLLLAHMVRRWDARVRGGRLSFVQAMALAASLTAVIDESQTQGADLKNLDALAPLALAEHWSDVTRFLALLHTEWPALLAQEGARDPMERRNAMLAGLAARLAAAPPPGMVIAAGSTGSIPATASLLSAIARLPKGAVVLPGLDRDLDGDAWNRLDPAHSQYGLKQLLERMGVAREDVPDWSLASALPARARLLSQALRPAPTTDAWRALADAGGGDAAKGLEGLRRVEAATPAEEAAAIALALREALEEPGRTAALVTPDRTLARRVAAELRRWDIAVDDSAGRPLAHAPAGAFLCLLAEAAGALFAPVPLLALLKHPFATLGQDGAAFRARARELDRWCLRGPRPDPGLAGITRAIVRAAAEPRNDRKDLPGLVAWWSKIAALLGPLENAIAQGEADLASLIEAHIAAAEALACDAQEICVLWRNDDGDAASALLAEFRDAAAALPPVEAAAYPPLFRGLALQRPVRTAFGRHPRLFILGTLEARLQRFDLTILGGLNEGGWPMAPGADPWFSRPMRARLGLEQPERAIGLAAHDFATLAAGPHVLLTRARKADGVPTIPSRWLQRLSQLTEGLGLAAEEAPYGRWAAAMAETTKEKPFRRPAATPPVTARPQKLSVTEIETWLRDPYAIYARHVLRLRPLDGIDELIGPLERGTALHRALELFVARHQDSLPENAALELAEIADGVFAELGIPKAALAVWRPRFLGAAHWFLGFERERRALAARSHLEVKGELKLGDFTLRGVADRIDRLKAGGAAVFDYKTGQLPTQKQVDQLLTPQLPLEAAMLAADGFGLGAMTAEELIYVRLTGGADPGAARSLKDAQALTARAVERLVERIGFFNRRETAYVSRVQPYSLASVGDYDHLARVREWSLAGWEE